MASDDHNYIANYIPGRLYINPGAKGAYASIASERTREDAEKILAEIEVAERFRLAVSAFYVSEKSDWNRLKITKLRFHRRYGWSLDGEIVLNNFDSKNLQNFLSVLNSLDMRDASKAKIDLAGVQLEKLSTILASDQSATLLNELANSPLLEKDIYAVAAKRNSLALFRQMMNEERSELEWQKFFEKNTWVFGYGLAFVFLESAGSKLENTTTGAAFDRSGKRVDALMRTRAAVSQYVLVEIKRPNTKLLRASEYRSGVWGASSELSDAVSQVQKTAYEFAANRFKDDVRDEFGNLTGETVFSVEPRTYLIIGNQDEITSNPEKIACFELYRRNIRAPEIITFDELLARAECIVDQLDTVMDDAAEG